MDFVKVIFAIILTPLGVFIEVGLRSSSWLNILLTLLGYIAGIVHAVWVIASRRRYASTFRDNVAAAGFTPGRLSRSITAQSVWCHNCLYSS